MGQRVAAAAFAIAAVVAGCKKKAPESSDAGAPPIAAAGPGFRLSDADLEKPAARSVVRGEPLSPQDTERLLGRLPAALAESDGATSFALRESSKPPPRPGREIATPFPPPASTAARPSDARATDAKLAVTRRSPTGAVPIAPNVSISFSAPMVELTSVAALSAKAAPAKLSPEQKGAWRWVGTQTLVFQPDGELPKATEYTVDVPAGVSDVGGRKLESAERFTFATPPPKLVRSLPNGQDEPTDPLLFAEFDQRVDPAAVVKAVRVMSDGVDMGARLATPQEIAQSESVSERLAELDKRLTKGRGVAFKPARALSTNSVVEVKFPAGTPSAEGPLKTTEEQGFKFNVYGPLEVLGLECSGRDCRPDSTVIIETSTSLDAEAFEPAQIDVAPKPDVLKVTPSGKRIVIAAKWKPHVKYELSIKKGLRDKHGQALARDVKRTLEVLPFEPRLLSETRMLTSVEPGARARASIFSRNEKVVRARVYRARPEMWPEYLRFRENWDSRGQDGVPPGELVFDRDVELAASEDSTTESFIDLAGALRDERGHAIVVVESKRKYEERWKREWSRQWVQVTRIGITAQQTSEGALTLFASDLARGNALAGVTFGFVPDGGAATSDAEGLAQLVVPAAERNHRVLLGRLGSDVAFVPYALSAGARTRSTKRFFSIDDRETYKPEETVTVKGLLRNVSVVAPGEMEVPRDLVGKALSWVATDARGAEISRGKSTLDDAGGLLITFKIPKNANLGPAAVAIQDSSLDTYAAETFTIQEFRRPEYEVGASVEGGPFVFGEHAVASVKASYYAGGGLAAAAAAWHVERSDASFTPPNRSDYHFGRRPFEAFFWGGDEDVPAEKKGKRFADWSGLTDASGVHRMRIDLDGTAERFPFTLAAQATVTDVNRQSWTARTSLLVHPARVSAGLKLDKAFVRAGEPIALDVIATDLEGAFAAGRKVRVTSARVTQELVKGKWKSARADSVTCDTVTKNGPSPKACLLATQKPGPHELVAEVADDKGNVSRTEMLIWVAGSLGENDRTLSRSRLELTPDKKTYRPGERAELLVKAPFAPAEGVLAVSGGKTMRRTHVKLTERMQPLTVPIEESDVTDLEVTLSLVGAAPRLDDKGDVAPALGTRPGYATATATLPIPPAGRMLTVVAKPESDAVPPGREVSIGFDVSDASGPRSAELGVFVVDEAVLALSGYKLEDPTSTFYQPIFERLFSLDSRSSIALSPESARGNMWGDSIGDAFGAGGLGLSGIGEGGGGRGEGIGLGNIGTIGHGGDAPPPPAAQARAAYVAQESSEFGMIGLLAKPASRAKGEEGSMVSSTAAISLRTKFDALAFFAPRVVTDERGHASVRVKMPESTTRYRVMALAWDKKDRFGKGESSITTRLPLLVRPSAPRFLNYGDRFELPVVLQNQTSERMRVAVAARATNAGLVESVGRAVDVPANDRIEVRFPAFAKQPGKARFQIAAAAGEFADAADAELPVWTPGTTEAFATYGVVDEGTEKQAVRVPEGVEQDFGGLDVSTSSTALFALSDAITYLVNYPYDCNEQIASRVLSVAALTEMLRAFNAPSLPSSDVLRGHVARDLDLLRARQDPSTGGFGFWVTKPWPYLTVHVAFALSLAKQKGYAVDPGMLARVKRYLADIDRHITQEFGPMMRRSLRAFALFVLKRLGEPDPVRARALIAEAGGAGELPLEALAWLLPTLAADPASASAAAEIKRIFSTRVTETAGAAHFVTSYGEGDWMLLSSDHRTDALVLNALVETDPKNDLIPKVVTGLLGARKKGHWLSTQEDAFVLLALDAYFQKFEKLAPSFVARVWLGDKTATEHAFRGYNVDRVETTVPMRELAKTSGGDLLVEKDGKGRLYYRVGFRYAPSDLMLPPVERGFAVTRRYSAVGAASDVTRDAKGVWHVKAGTAIRIHLTMNALAERHHVALVDPMPAGFEAVNPALAVSAVPTDAEGKAPKQPGGWFWWRTWYEHQNLRDERAEAFATMLPAGVYEYVYTARATTPGSFVVPPTKAEEMYSPETFGRGSGDRVVVE